MNLSSSTPPSRHPFIRKRSSPSQSNVDPPQTVEQSYSMPAFSHMPHQSNPASLTSALSHGYKSQPGTSKRMSSPQSLVSIKSLHGQGSDQEQTLSDLLSPTSTSYSFLNDASQQVHSRPSRSRIKSINTSRPRRARTVDAAAIKLSSLALLSPTSATNFDASPKTAWPHSFGSPDASLPPQSFSSIKEELIRNDLKTNSMLHDIQTRESVSI